MDRGAKDAIRGLVLDLRETLEAEIERELGRYGIYAERAWIDASDLSRLSDKERDQDRPRIEAAIRREQEAGLSRAEAVEALVRETAYTHMNRLLGLKCMEVRGLIEETITTRPIYSDRSKRHRDYLEEHEQAHREPDRGLLAMLQQAYAEVSQHIGVVFDPDSDYSIVWPRHTVLKECISQINAVDGEVTSNLGEDPETMASVYTDDTVLGWVYQYFQEKEKKRVFDDVYKKKKKISGYDIIPATTAYTERYMVQFLIENSLGALWMEMYPGSDLCEEWEYFVEDPNLQNEDGTRKQGREPRPVAELTLLDPACGSGHFLLYAFDLFAQMYEAEAGMEGRALDRPEIARRILRDNLYGIDIDLRSIQISALNLYMKACTYTGARLSELQSSDPMQMNLVCADIVLRRGTELKELLDLFKDDPLTQELIRTIWRGLENARELGSLLKVEEQVDAVIARKREVERGTLWEHPEGLWDQWKQDFLDTLKEYVDRAAESFDVNRQMFGREAIKGVQLLDLLTRRYDVVTTNPPFMGDRNMGSSLKAGMKRLYPDASSDLYAASIDRFSALTRPYGFLSMIIQQTMMFTKDFECLRETFLGQFVVHTVAHLGPGAFEDVSGVKVSVALLTAIKVQKPRWRCCFFQLVDTAQKGHVLKKLCRVFEEGSRFEVSQDSFHDVPGKPFLYWAGEDALAVFRTARPLSDFAEVKTGLSTGHDARFLRTIWEVPRSEILLPADEFRNAKWFLHPKGGGYCKYHGNLDTVILWEDEGALLKSSGASIRNEVYYYREGLTYSLVSTTRFSVREMPRNCVFNFGGSAVFPTELPREYLLGLLNTSLVNTLLNMLNPTTNYPVGDVSKIPVVLPSHEQRETVCSLARQCVRIRKWLSRFDPTDLNFRYSCLEEGLQADPDAYSVVRYYQAFQKRKEDMEVLYSLAEGLIERIIADLYRIDLDATARVDSSSSLPVAWHPVAESHRSLVDDLVGELAPELEEYLDELCPNQRSSSDLPKLAVALERLYTTGRGKSIEEISTELETNPISIVALRQQMGLTNPNHLRNAVEDFLTHRIWKLCRQDEDGIIPYDDGLKNPALLEQVRGEIEAVFGPERAVAIEAEMDEILGRGGLAGWLGNPFFRKHASQFKKRPILWQITSPDQQFRVLVYYHKLDHDTLPKIRSQYLRPLLERANTRLRAARRQDPHDMKTIGDLEAYIADFEECDRLLQGVIEGTIDVDLPDWANGPYRGGKAPYDPDLDDGVKVNILPPQAAGLLPMKKVV